jgi:hypothetical protein
MTMACDCIKKLQKELTERYDGTVFLDTVIDMYDGSLRVDITGQYRKKGRNGEFLKKYTQLHFMPKYCPFCGKPYNPSEESEDSI